MANIDLHKIQNPECETKCRKKERKTRTLDDLCTDALSVKDGLALRCVGEWAERKIFYLVQYFGIFTQGMSKKWSGTNYVEIASGPGRCIERNDGIEFDGTALAIAQHKNLEYLKKAIFFDINTESVAILKQRFNQIGSPKLQAHIGDYTNSSSICGVLAQEIPKGHLNFVFIDPTDCSVPLSLVKAVKTQLGKVDFVINVATGTDFNRNVKKIIENPESYNKVKNKYSSFLGSDEFFNDESVLELASNSDDMQLRLKFRDYYISGLRSIGMNFFNYKPIKHYYDLIFASASDTGLDFWKKASAMTFTGQREWIF